MIDTRMGNKPNTTKIKYGGNIITKIKYRGKIVYESLKDIYLCKNGVWQTSELPMSIITSGNFTATGFTVTQQSGYVECVCYGTSSTGNMGWNISSADANTWLADKISKGYKYLNIELQTEAYMGSGTVSWQTKLKTGYNGSGIIDDYSIYAGNDPSYTWITTNRKIDISTSTSFYLNCLSQKVTTASLGTSAFQMDRLYNIFLSKD